MKGKSMSSDDMTFENLPKEVIEELQDPKYITRKHYARATYALGCHGPLCRKSEKDRGRRRNKAKILSEGREYKPGNHRREDPEMDLIVEWYLNEYYNKNLKKEAS